MTTYTLDLNGELHRGLTAEEVGRDGPHGWRHCHNSMAMPDAEYDAMLAEAA